jgi:hypothetical protein
VDLFTWVEEQDAKRLRKGQVIDIRARLDERIHRYLDLLEGGYRPHLDGTLLPFLPFSEERKRA